MKALSIGCMIGAVLCLAGVCKGADASRWHMAPDGRSIGWTPSSGDIPYSDHVEMTGEQVSVVLRWGVDARGAFTVDRSLVFPLLRTLPNDTHASLVRHLNLDATFGRETVKAVAFDGMLRVESEWRTEEDGRIGMTRTLFPSRTLPAFCEMYTLVNLGSEAVCLSVPAQGKSVRTEASRGLYGAYEVSCEILEGGGFHRLGAGDTLAVGIVYRGGRAGERHGPVDLRKEYGERRSFLDACMSGSLVLETPSRAVDTEFALSKVRAAESIIKTRGGYMHAPGGEVFYAAIWANDQAEYVNPFFPFLGYEVGNASAINAFRHFARFMNPRYDPLPSSIIAEGLDIWNGAGDRGDAAMIAYGASRFALALGRRDVAVQLWPLVEWCLEYCRRHLDGNGVVTSDTDELEGRFPAGKANLCTSSLYYDALLSAACLAEELGIRQDYRAQRQALGEAISSFFPARVSGYETFRYYEGNELLRSWICMPLIVGLDVQVEGTVAALLGPELMTENGLLTQQGSTTFWDRSTLYALRGLFNAGHADEAATFLEAYSRKRLLGEHVPYPIEAWPEGEQRQLSAESGLYCRIITEGLFGIRPTGLGRLELTPRLPSTWKTVTLRHIRAFDSDFSIQVRRAGRHRYRVLVTGPEGVLCSRRIREGETLPVIIRPS